VSRIDTLWGETAPLQSRLCQALPLGGLFPMDGVCALLGFPGGELGFFLAFRLSLGRLEDTVI
jgi:hypothetical protein